MTSNSENRYMENLLVFLSIVQEIQRIIFCEYCALFITQSLYTVNADVDVRLLDFYDAQ